MHDDSLLQREFVTGAPLSLSVGGLHLSLVAPVAWAQPFFPPEYAAFVASPGCRGGGDDALTLAMELGDPQAAPGWTAAFRSGTWTLYREGAWRHFVWESPAGPRGGWRASFIPGQSTIRVTCGVHYLRGGDAGPCLVNPFHYPLDQLVLMYALASRGAVIVHGAGLVLEDGTALAVGRSGAGKSTLSRFWQQRQGTESVLSDDRVIVRRGAPGRPGCLAHGSPWPGDLGAAQCHAVPLKALLLLVQAPANRLTRLAPREALERLLPMVSIPWFDREIMPLALAVADQCLSEIPAYEFQCVRDLSAADAVADLLKGRDAGSPGSGA